MFGTTVFNLDDEVFEHPMAEYKEQKGYKLDTEMTAEDWKELVSTFKDVFKKKSVSISRRMFTSSLSLPPKPFLNHGTASVPLPTARRKAFPTTLARRSTS